MEEDEDLKPGDLVRLKSDPNMSYPRIVLKTYILEVMDVWSIKNQKKYEGYNIKYFIRVE